jgi:hypothetical protein
MLMRHSTYSAIKTLGILIVISFVVLFMFEIKSYYFPTGAMDNPSLLEALKRNPNVETSVTDANNNIVDASNNKEKYSNILTDDRDFRDIFQYLEDVDSGYEADFKTDMDDDEETLGCFDNDMLLQNMVGSGKTCKSEKGAYFDIYKKELVNPKNGKEYSFAEVCPVTSGQERPIMCLYKKGSHINNINKKMANVIDQVQLNQGNRLSKVENATSYHIADPNRLFNGGPIKQYNRYENDLEMGFERRYTNEDQLDDLVLYGKRLSANLA